MTAEHALVLIVWSHYKWLCICTQTGTSSIQNIYIIITWQVKTSVITCGCCLTTSNQNATHLQVICFTGQHGRSQLPTNSWLSQAAWAMNTTALLTATQRIIFTSNWYDIIDTRATYILEQIMIHVCLMHFNKNYQKSCLLCVHHIICSNTSQARTQFPWSLSNSTKFQAFPWWWPSDQSSAFKSWTDYMQQMMTIDNIRQEMTRTRVHVEIKA